MSNLKIHAICIALNEEPFISNLIDSLYPFCQGISIITQHDRDYYGKKVEPDNMVGKVLSYPDPEGKIHLICRKYNDETASRNSEMLSLITKPTRGIISHGVPLETVKAFHAPPDYFLIVDADEIYDTDTLGEIIDYLGRKRPRAMRVTAHQYRFTWNERIPLRAVRHHHFGFVKAGILFEQRRVITWNEQRLSKLFTLLKLPNYSSGLLGFIDCPTDVGMFHHGSYLGGKSRLMNKFKKHSHQEVNNNDYINSISKLPFEMIPTEELPKNIQNGSWPADFFSK